MMDAARLLNVPVIVEHVDQSGPPDEMGDPTELRTWTRFLGYVWQQGTTEDTANGTVAVETTQLALRRDAAGHIDTGDRVIVDGRLDDDGNLVPDVGETFDVAGAPWQARNPRTGLVEYLQATLKRSE